MVGLLTQTCVHKNEFETNMKLKSWGPHKTHAGGKGKVGCKYIRSSWYDLIIQDINLVVWEDKIVTPS